MSAPTNTVTTLISVGNREDLSDVISRVAPEETPLISNIGTQKVSAIYSEWQTETLAAADPTNAQLEGDDIGTFSAGNLTTRVGNYCQIYRKDFLVSRTEEVVNKAGRSSEIARQKTLKGLEMRRDEEARYIGNYASVAESGATTRKSASLQAWITTNDSRGAGGSDGGFSGGIVAAATNGTQRTFTEVLVKTVLSTAFESGGRPSLGFMKAAHKQQFAAFTGIADIRVNANPGKMANIIAGADMYTSDFGNITLVPHPYEITRACLFVDPDKVKVGVLDGVKSKRLADTGDSEKYMMTKESTLVVLNEKAHAIVADLT